MKKTIFSLITSLLLFTLTMGVFYLPNSFIYKIKQPASEFKTWAEIWGYIAVIILCKCALEYYMKLGEKLYDYLKKD